MEARFQSFNPWSDLTKHRRRLPHWEQPLATYFVTFRLADSLPAEAVQRLQEMRELGTGFSPILWTWFDELLGKCTGKCPLAEPANARIVAEALRHFDRQRYSLGDFVVMPNHVHALVQPHEGRAIGPIVHGWKSYSAHRLQRTGVIRGQVWQAESFDRIVREQTELRRIATHIRENPIEAHLPGDRYILGQGSARWSE